jgi:predicted ATPase
MSLLGRDSEAIQMINSGTTGWRAAGSTVWIPCYFSHLAKSYAVQGQFDDAWHRISEAMSVMKSTKEAWCQAEVHRMAGEITLLSREGPAKAEGYFERALAIARAQATKSWELRAAISMARLWRDQDKRREARELLSPVHGWFTEGFETRDLKEAKGLLDELL